MPTKQECNCNDYKNAHALVRRHLLKLYPLRCMLCGSERNIEAANVSDNPYSRDKRDYIFLCKRCHVTMDGHDNNLTQGRLAVEKARKERAAGLKTCPRCKETKELDGFRTVKLRRYGKFPYCIPCERIINREKDIARRGVEDQI
jgi:hypothetical protein